jgi:hypothetical protein
MALAHGYALPFVTQKVVGDYASDNAAAAARAIASGGKKEAAGSCLDARAINLQMRVPQRTDTNLLTNSAMAGATGSVLPTKWVSGSVNGLTVTISSAFTSAGFQAIDWTVSGTAIEDGTIYIGCEPNDNTNAIPASIGQQYIGAMSLGKQAGTIPATMVMQVLGQKSSDGTVNETANSSTDLSGLASGSLTRINTAVLSIASVSSDRVNFRLTADVAALDVISFTIRIAAPQVERNDRISPYITTTTGAASRVTGQPSLLIVPQLTRAGFVYPQLPVVSGADFTFTRATTATRVNASGLIESVASGLLRIDYPVTGGCPAALIEPAATNLVVQSQNWLASGWRSDASSNVTTVTGTSGTLDPLGTNTANAISPTSGNVGHFKVGSDGTINFTSGTIHTFSGFFKQGTGSAGRYVQLTSPAVPFTQLFYANFDLQLGTIVATGSVSSDSNRAASIESYGNGWYRCRVTATCNVTATSVGFVANLITASGDTRGPSFAGTTTDILYGWGAQLETGAIPTTYIPTTTASATRNADVCSVSGVSGYIGQTEGTIYAEVDLRNLGLIASLINIQTTAYTSGAVRIETTASNQLRIQIRDASGNSRLDNTISSPTLSSGINKIAVGYSSDASGVITALNGTIINTTTVSASFGSLGATKVHLGTREQAGAYDLFLNNRIRAAAIYTTRLTNDQLANITRLT